MEVIQEEYCNISDIYRGSGESKLTNQIIGYLLMMIKKEILYSNC